MTCLESETTHSRSSFGRSGRSWMTLSKRSINALAEQFLAAASGNWKLAAQ